MKIYETVNYYPAYVARLISGMCVHHEQARISV